MFAATGDSLPAHGVVECTGVAHNLLDRSSVTAAAKGIVGVVIERDIEHRAKIEIETENAQQPSGDVTVTTDKIDIVLVAELLRIRRLVADETQTRNATAFLVDRDDRFDLAQIAQVVDQFTQLRRGRDVAP